MARPFRFQPPSPPSQALVRRRLLAQLDERWERRLVTIVAGPGFGKTSLLASATDPDRAPIAGHDAGRDVWLSCEPADEAAENLVAGLATALDLPPQSDLDRILDSVWAEAPRSVCFVVDNVHEIAPTSEGAAVLRRLLDDLPANGHVLLASREVVPLPTARLAASGQLVRIRERDLLFDVAELGDFATLRGVDRAVLASSGGWPALAELAASAGADLVVDYLWEEVLTRIGPERSRLLAMLSVAGGGDDEMVSVLAGHASRVEDLVAGVPLVERASGGWVALHPLWAPPLRRLLTEAEAQETRRTAAAVHRAAERLDAAAELLIEAEDWTSLLALMRDAAVRLTPVEGIVRWYRSLPASGRRAPAALFAEALDVQSRAPSESLPIFGASAAAFRAVDDVEGELSAMLHEGTARWWANDFGGLFVLFQRVTELAATGSRRAMALDAVGRAAVAHVQGDSARVLSLLAQAGDDIPADWPVDLWFMSVAHRRNGDLARAYEALDRYAKDVEIPRDPQAGIARLRIDWLRGDVDHVLRLLPDVCAFYEGRDRYLRTESALELASKLAWLGDGAGARELLATIAPGDMPSVVARTLHLIAVAAIAIADGDEAGAAALLSDNDDATPGRPESWYWRDRAALAAPYVLISESRAGWAAEPLGPAHQPGLALARAFVAAREGDDATVRALAWPDAGLVRAHLPRCWAVELAAAGLSAGNPPPDDLLVAIGTSARSDLRAVIERPAPARIAAAAKELLGRVPAAPAHRLRVGVLGPLEVWSDGEVVSHPHLRRQRVRELLCLLVARRRMRREEAADELWPELLDPGRNLRTTLNYLQQVLQPDRGDGDPPYFLRGDGPWLALAGGDDLEVDVWELNARLDEAEAAERANAPGTALAAYREVIPLWRGEPFADVVEGMWAHAERTRSRTRYTAAAVRAGELLLATSELADARVAANAAIRAEPSHEPAYQLLARIHLREGNAAAARVAVEDCRAVLADLGLEPGPATLALI